MVHSEKRLTDSHWSDKKINKEHLKSDSIASNIWRNSCQFTAPSVGLLILISIANWVRSVTNIHHAVPEKCPEEAKRLKRQFERNMTMSQLNPLITDLDFTNKPSITTVITKAKTASYTELISRSKDDPMKLWKSLNHVLHQELADILQGNPTDSSMIME